MKNKLIIFATIAIALLTSFLSIMSVGAAPITKDQLLCDPFGKNCQTEAETEINTMVSDVITYALWAVGAIAVVFLIYGGLSFTLSGGDPEKVKKAKSTVFFSLIGLGLAILAGVIVSLVVNASKELTK
jgi:hypothetical protein